MSQRHLRLLAVALAVTHSGCASFDLSEPIPWKDNTVREAKTPQRMVGVWTDTAMHTAGRPSTRGFGGRIFFYDERSKAVPVEGTLVVYAFDDSKDPSLSRSPDRRFVFRPDELARHADPESKLGQSYSVWLPWDGVGGLRKQITLVPMFTTKDGKVVAGEQSKLVLPGRDPAPAVAHSPYDHRAAAYGVRDEHPGRDGGFYDPAVQRASYAAPAGNPFAHPTHTGGGYHSMDTLSIPMTDSLKQHLLTSPPEQADFSGPSLRATPPPRPAASGNLPAGNQGGFSLRTTGGAAQAPTVTTGTMSPGERYQSEMARAGAVLAEAQAGQQQAANWASNRTTPLGPRTSRFARRTPPVPGGGVATPIHGLAHSQPSPGPRRSARPATPPESPPVALPATASNVGIAPY